MFHCNLSNGRKRGPTLLGSKRIAWHLFRKYRHSIFIHFFKHTKNKQCSLALFLEIPFKVASYRPIYHALNLLNSLNGLNGFYRYPLQSCPNVGRMRAILSDQINSPQFRFVFEITFPFAFARRMIGNLNRWSSTDHGLVPNKQQTRSHIDRRASLLCVVRVRFGKQTQPQSIIILGSCAFRGPAK